MDVKDIKIELWDKYLANRNDENRNALVMCYYSYIQSLAYNVSYAYDYNLIHNKDDLINVGVIGMMDAIDKYDPDNGAPFEAYAKFRVVGTMIDYLRKLDKVSRRAREFNKQIEQVKDTQFASTGIRISDEEACHLIDSDCDNIKNFKSYGVCNLDNNIWINKNIDNTDVYLHRDSVKYILSKCTYVEQIIILLYYYKFLKFSIIGTILGVSESRISQIHANILRRFSTDNDLTKIY